MATKAKLKRRSFLVEQLALRRARKARGPKTDAEVIRLSVVRIATMEASWQFMNKSQRTLSPRQHRGPMTCDGPSWTRTSISASGSGNCTGRDWLPSESPPWYDSRRLCSQSGAGARERKRPNGSWRGCTGLPQFDVSQRSKTGEKQAD